MKQILISQQSWATRVAIIEDKKLHNVYFWAHSCLTLEKSFFKGIVSKILPGIQTAFVDIGQEKSGFLHISEVDRELAMEKMTDHFDNIEDETNHTFNKEKDILLEERHPVNISKIFKEKEHILVQVSKEPVNHKGAKLTTCFTLPGRFVVLMPSIPRICISKKIIDRDERNRLKELVMKELPEGMGVIVRTCSESRDADILAYDIKFLVQTWNDIQKKYSTAAPYQCVFEDIELPFQAVRDHLDSDIELVIVDSKDLYDKIVKFVKNIAPEYVTKIKLYLGQELLFEKYNLESQIQDALHKKVDLKSGGSIIIESTEAMTVVDVNTGRYIGKSNLEDTILKTNLEAAEEIVRQLKVRNIGGLIVIDFIDMANVINRQKLFKTFEKYLKEQDKSQSVLLKISEFGLVQMTRKRSGKTLARQLTSACLSCQGTGHVVSFQAECFIILTQLYKKLELQKHASEQSVTLIVRLNPRVFEYVLSIEYQTIFDFEKKYTTKIILESDCNLKIGEFTIT